MPSRMERYYENDLLTTGRSSKNKSLYDQIHDLDSYTNIEGVETIEHNNEIDISRVKKMLNNRENYRKERELKSILNEKEDNIIERETSYEEVKNYDINDLLNQAKNSNSEDDNYRKLDENSYRELKNISKKSKLPTEEDIEEISNLIKTIKISKEEIENTSEDEDSGLLDDLKSDTVVGDASSIKELIDEEKNKEIEATNEGIDKSFYTTNFGLTKKDFEDLKDLNVQVSKTNNKIMILLMIIIIIIIVAFTVIIFT